MLRRAEAARTGGRREGDELRPLGNKARGTRSALLRAAYDCFVQNGYRATSVQDIHEAADVSLGTFYQYFREKADVMATLVGDLIVESADELFRPFSGSAGRTEVTASAVEPFVRHYAATADFQRVWEEVTHIEEDMARIRWDVTELIDAGLRDAIVADQDAGRIAPGLDAMATARALNAMVDRYCYRTFVVQGRRDRKSVEVAVDTLVSLWANALRSVDKT